MTLKEYVKIITKLLKDNPEAKDYQVIASSDAEGNSYESVYYKPSLGYFKDNEFDTDQDNNNAVCIN